jgi:hypothetical protein
MMWSSELATNWRPHASLMIRFAGASMTICLVVVRLTLWARIYHDHSWLLASAVLLTVLGQQ